MRNRFPGMCYFCGCPVPKGAGHFELVKGKGWRTIHSECVFKQRAEKVDKE